MSLPSLLLLMMLCSALHQGSSQVLQCHIPGDVVFLLDGSDSISDDDWVKGKNFIRGLIDHLEIGPKAIHVGMVVYSSKIGDVVGLKQFRNKNELKRLAGGLYQPKDGTDTATGIARVRKMMRAEARQNAPHIAIVITDGRSRSPRQTIAEANLAKSDGISMIAVGVGHAIFMEELRQIASSKLFQVTDFGALQNIIKTMKNLICKVITTTTTPASTTITTAPVMATKTSLSPGPVLQCHIPGDIVFLLDGSDSISDDDWVKGKNFIRGLIDHLEIGSRFIHVGMVVYSSKIGDVVGLKQFRNKNELKRLAGGLYQPKDGTDTAKGIARVRTMMRVEARKNAPRIAIVITDGRSRSPRQTIAEANLAKSNGIIVIAVGVGHAIFMEELEQIASSKGELFQVTDFGALQNIIKMLKDHICRVITTTTTSTTTTTTTTTPPPTTTTTTTPPPTTTTTPLPTTTVTTPPLETTSLPQARELCEGCIIDKGVGYNPHPTDCTKYVQCYLDSGKFNAIIMPCPFGTFWDQNLITCQVSNTVDCPSDPCISLPEKSTYANPDLCGAHWMCVQKRSTALCCPENSTFVPQQGCVKDQGCFKPCPPNLGSSNGDDNGKDSMTMPCMMRPYKNDSHFYIQNVPGFGDLVQSCAPGSTFQEKICGCQLDKDNAATLPRVSECKPMAYYTFNKNLKDDSGNNLMAGFRDVKQTKNGTARFSGKSVINIWRFAGVDYGTHLTIKLRYRNSGMGASEQALVTNCHGRGKEGPSILLLSSKQSVTFKIKTVVEGKKEGQLIGSLTLPAKSDFNDVTLKYDGQQLTGTVNGISKSTQLQGKIERRQAGLLIGACEGYSNFHGEIDYIYIYLCVPKTDENEI